MSKSAVIALREAAAALDRQAKKLRQKANLIELLNREPAWSKSAPKKAKRVARRQIDLEDLLTYEALEGGAKPKRRPARSKAASARKRKTAAKTR